jgi:short-subunit dehydrogenase
VVSCLCPGLTRTEFHQRAGQDPGHYPRWAWQEAAEVAAAGLAGAAAGKVTVVPGRANQAARYAMTLAPAGLLRWADRRVRPGNRTDGTDHRPLTAPDEGKQHDRDE